MKNSNPIFIELETLSAAVAGIPAVNPYKVPSGYFDGFTDRMLLLVKEDSIPSWLPPNLQQPYAVPDGYFEKFAGEMLAKLKAEKTSVADELETLSPLLSGLQKKMPFSVPEGYFEQSIPSTKEKLSPTLESLRGKNVYTTPARYFEELPLAILNKVGKQTQAKVVSVSFGRRILQYAAAAVVVGVIATTAILYFNPSKPTDIVSQTNTSLPTDIRSKIEQTSDEAIFSFLDEEDISYADATIEQAIPMDEEAIKSMLADVSDEAIEQYLETQTDARQPLTN